MDITSGPEEVVMNQPAKPATIIRVISAIQVLYLCSLPVLANFTVVPMLDSIPGKFAWAYFGLLGLPITFAGLKVFNRFPMDPLVALLQVLFIPVASGLWWWVQEGTLLEYFAILLIFEALAILLSLFLMSFIPMRFYDPDNPRAKGLKNYFVVLFSHGILLGGGFIVALGSAMWPWWKSDPFWQHPFTLVLLLLAAIEYIYRNVQYQRNKEHTREVETLSIEPLLIFSPIPWAISWALLV